MTYNGKILIIDDEEDMLENCSRILERNKYSCITTSDSLKALEITSKERPAIVLTDLKMPEKDGIEVLKDIKGFDPSIIVIVFTAYATIPFAVEAIRKGAFDFIAKPFTSDQLRVSVERALNRRCLEQENINLHTQIEYTYGLDKIIGNSSEIKEVFEVIKKVAKTEANIFI